MPRQMLATSLGMGTLMAAAASHSDGSRRTLMGGGASCDDTLWVLHMSDSFGDGWNGNQILIKDCDGEVLYGPAGLSYGSYQTLDVCLPESEGYDIDCGVSHPGSYTSEVSWELESGNYPYETVSGGVGEVSTCPVFVCPHNDWVIHLHDSFGDGWNGNMLTVTNCMNEVLADQITINGWGSYSVVDVCLSPGGGYIVSAGGGSWQNEISWTLADETGADVLSLSGAGAATTCPAVPCQAGSFGGPLHAFCEPCANGTWSGTDTAISCTPCPIGSKTGHPPVSCTLCEAGQFSTGPSLDCEVCPAGRYGPVEGAKEYGGICNATNLGMTGDVCTTQGWCSEHLCPSCSPGESVYDCHPEMWGGPGCPNGIFEWPCDEPIWIGPIWQPSVELPCEACTTTGQYCAAGSMVSEGCTPGFADLDLDPSTPCEFCPVGTVTSCGAVACAVCIPGKVDADLNPATACTSCPAGSMYHSEIVEECTPTDPCMLQVGVNCTSDVCAYAAYAPAISSAQQQNESCAPANQCTLTPGTDCTSSVCSYTAYSATTLINETCSGQYLLSGQITQCIDGFITNKNCTETVNESCVYQPLVQNVTAEACAPSVSCPLTVGVNCSETSPDCAYVPFVAAVAGVDIVDESCTPTVNCTLTPGVDCTNDVCSYAHHVPANTTNCEICPPGRADTDSDPLTPCVICPTETFAPGAGVICEACPPGFMDMDENSATPCEFQGDSNPCSTQACAAGFHDHDCHSATPCMACPNGTAQPHNDRRRENGPLGSGEGPENMCESCTPGRFDNDSNPATACAPCPAGSFSGNASLVCEICPRGYTDLDVDPSTPCEICPGGHYTAQEMANGSCTACAEGRASSVIASTANTCQDCPPGWWTSSSGAVHCSPCPSGSYRTHGDIFGCIECKMAESPQYLCDEANLTWPKAAPGYFVQWPDNNTAGLVAYAECTPFIACVGGVGDLTYMGEKASGCAKGYTGSRCSSCVDRETSESAAAAAGVEADPPGYFRRDGVCQACPKGNKIKIIIIAVLVMFISLMVLLDKLVKTVDHFGQKIAPVVVLITICQMIGSLVSFGLNWPPELLELISMINMININVEMVAPECSVKVDFSRKLSVILLAPFILVLMIILNSVMSYFSYQNSLKKFVDAAEATGEDPDEAREKFEMAFKIKHQMHPIEQHLVYSATNIGMFLFNCVAIAYVRAIISGFACTRNSDGKDYLAAQSDIQCGTDYDGNYHDPRYEEISDKAWTGAFVFGMFLFVVVMAMANPRFVVHSWADFVEFAMLKRLRGRVNIEPLEKLLNWLRHLADKLDTSEVLHFAGEKMLAQYFWWDSMVLVRKIALVVVGSLAVTTSSAGGVALTWYFGVGITIVALVVHAFARPFYDPLVDTTEFLGLITMLLLFQSGIVFKLLNDPADPRNNPANFDSNLDGFIDQDEYESLLCRDSFDHLPPRWDLVGKDSIHLTWELGAATIELSAFDLWWTSNHSQVANALMRLSFSAIMFTVLYGIYAEIAVIFVCTAREVDGGVSDLNALFQKNLDKMQAEFQRHMTDIYHIAKGSLENDDDLDCYSQALLGIMEQEQMLTDHTKVMKRIAVQTFLEIAEEPDENVNWAGSRNLYENEPEVETNEDESVKARKRAEREARNAHVRDGFEHWEREAFARRLFKHDKEWVSRGGGYFIQEGSSLLHTHAVEDNVMAIMSQFDGKEELINNMFAYHQRHIDADINAAEHRARLRTLLTINKAHARRAATFESEQANPMAYDVRDEKNDLNGDDLNDSPEAGIDIELQDAEMAYRKPYLMTQLTSKLDAEGLALLHEVLAHKDETIAMASKLDAKSTLARLRPSSMTPDAQDVGKQSHGANGIDEQLPGTREVDEEWNDAGAMDEEDH